MSGAVDVQPNVEMGRYLGWTEGRLVFKDSSLSDVVAQLERWYDLRITLVDTTLATLPLTATFEDESTSEILNVVATALDLRYERDRRSITFYPAQARLRSP